MIFFKKTLMIACLLVLCSTQSGCELLALPGQLFSGIFNLAGQALAVADSLPKPPPGVFF
jgi:hypothetical protein